MKRAILIASGFLMVATIALAQQKYRREHLICPVDGARMDWTGNQKTGVYDSSCEFSHIAFEDMKRVEHKAWASCTEIR
jgi:hypothetical protein